MKKLWCLLPIIIVLSACGGGGSGDSGKTPKQPDQKTYQLSLTGNVYSKSGTENMLNIYAGDTKLGQGKTASDGSYSVTVDIDENTYLKAQEKRLRLIATQDSFQLVNLLTTKLSDGVSTPSLKANVSSFSTADYILADLNSNGEVTHQEWQTYQSSQDTNLVNRSLIRYAVVVESAIDNKAIVATSDSIGWLTELKTPVKWNQWYNQHRQSLELAWSSSFNEPEMITEASAYIKGKENHFSDYRKEEVLKATQETALCRLAIHAEDPAFAPEQGEVGQQWQLKATISDSLTGSLIEGQPVWRSTNTAIATISNNGLMKYLTKGTAEINAKYTNASSSCSALSVVVTVNEKQPEPVKLHSISIDPLPASITEKDTVKLLVTGTWSDKSTEDVTSQVNWKLDPAELVRIEDNTLTALSAGQVTITATYQAGNVLLDDSQTFTIRKIEEPVKPKLTKIRIDGYSGVETVGETWQLKAFGLYSDKTQSDLSSNVTWNSSTPHVATVNATGLVTAKAAGVAYISASYNGITQTLAVSVTEPIYSLLLLSGDLGNLKKGDEIRLSDVMSVQAFSKQGGQKKDVTKEVTWFVPKTSIATVSNGILVVLGEGKTVLVAGWKRPDGKEIIGFIEFTVNLPEFVSFTPDISDGTLTVSEGNILPLEFKAKFADGSERVYQDITVKADEDSSGLNIAKYDTEAKIIRALRAGKTTLKVNNVPREVLNKLPAKVDKDDGKITLDLVVEDNPDVYQWHRTISPYEREFNTQNMIYGDVLYQFWYKMERIDSETTAQAGYVSTFDGAQFRKQKLLTELGLISNEMIDGGGHGYHLLISADFKENIHYDIYNLLEETKHTVDFSTAPISGILEDKRHVNPFGFTSNGDLIVLGGATNADEKNTEYTAYLYRKRKDDQSQWEWQTGKTVVGENLMFIQLPSLSGHLVLRDQSDDKSVAPKYHFINRETGKVDKVMSLRYPDSASGSYCEFITLVPGSNIDQIGAFCDVVDETGLVTTGHWVWQDINDPPKIIKKMLNETVNSDGFPVAARDKNGQIIASSGYVERGGNHSLTERYSLQLNETDPHSGEPIITEVALFSPVVFTAKPLYSGVHPLGESQFMLMENPNVLDELVMMTNRGMVVKSAKHHLWMTNKEMYFTPRAMDSSVHLFQLKNSWFIIPRNFDNEIWELQMRKPKM